MGKTFRSNNEDSYKFRNRKKQNEERKKQRQVKRHKENEQLRNEKNYGEFLTDNFERFGRDNKGG
jgi:hypothetical protein